MSEPLPATADRTAAQINLVRQWVQTWQKAGPELERIRRDELRALDTQRAIALLCGSSVAPPTPRTTSGLIDQQRWFMLAANHG